MMMNVFSNSYYTICEDVCLEPGRRRRVHRMDK